MIEIEIESSSPTLLGQAVWPPSISPSRAKAITPSRLGHSIKIDKTGMLAASLELSPFRFAALARSICS